jgi:hypothetical protein
LKLKDISKQFSNISFSHVYKENNAHVDSLSKEGLHLAPNTLSEEEHVGGVIVYTRSLSIDDF